MGGQTMKLLIEYIGRDVIYKDKRYTITGLAISSYEGTRYFLYNHGSLLAKDCILADGAK